MRAAPGPAGGGKSETGRSGFAASPLEDRADGAKYQMRSRLLVSAVGRADAMRAGAGGKRPAGARVARPPGPQTRRPPSRDPSAARSQPSSRSVRRSHYPELRHIAHSRPRAREGEAPAAPRASAARAPRAPAPAPARRRAKTLRPPLRRASLESRLPQVCWSSNFARRRRPADSGNSENAAPAVQGTYGGVRSLLGQSLQRPSAARSHRPHAQRDGRVCQGCATAPDGACAPGRTRRRRRCGPAQRARCGAAAAGKMAAPHVS